MTEQSQFTIGTVAQEAARLIEDMATMARQSSRHDQDSSSQAGGPDASPTPAPTDHGARPAEGPGATYEPRPGFCSSCGAHTDDVPATCRLCPVCRGVALLRSIRPETVDLLADLAVVIASSLRDVATRARAASPPSSGEPTRGGSRDGDRVTVQDIPVDDQSDGHSR